MRVKKMRIEISGSGDCSLEIRSAVWIGGVLLRPHHP